MQYVKHSHRCLTYHLDQAKTAAQCCLNKKIKQCFKTAIRWIESCEREKNGVSK